MDKETRNAIERATQRARKILEEDFSAQLDGDFDVHPSGEVAAKAGPHLSRRQAFQREKIVAAIEHKRATGMEPREAVADYLRDAAFTTLNRFVALKMLEARELVQECITRGEQSVGYREFCGLAPGLPLLAESAGYRLYIESLFDELSTEVKVLFDRRDPSSVLWPRRATFEQLLETLNAEELKVVWGEDETIGWVYQFFNGQDERREMREESQAPRNSRELAVRNQFFTPRYVVQFLTDNTLGRIWYEMRATRTTLADRCEYMVRKPDEEFAPRAKKDPRDVRVLDPACGSGHFLLYAFDLFLAMYEEAHADGSSPKSEATGHTLAEDYPSLDALRMASPGLILAHNLHGVDIDPRCAQIAQLALWMRAQKAFRDSGARRADRAQIRRSNIVIAEPLVADAQVANEFVKTLDDAELGRVFSTLVEGMKLAGELGLLSRVEELVAPTTKRGKTGDLFAPPEERIRASLQRFITEEEARASTRRRLFADDTAQALGLLGVSVKKFDVILMNPPFGSPSRDTEGFLEEQYSAEAGDLAAAFVTAATRRLDDGGLVGVIATRKPLFIKTFSAWRERTLLAGRAITTLVDLGRGVLDATVEAAAYVVSPRPERRAQCFRCFEGGLVREDAPDALRAAIQNGSGSPTAETFTCDPSALAKLPNSPFAYWVSPDLLHLYDTHPAFSESRFKTQTGASTKDDFRFLRLWPEVSPSRVARTREATFAGKAWVAIAKGGEYAPYFRDVELVMNWERDGAEAKAFVSAYRAAHGWSPGWAAELSGADYYFRPGVTWSRRTSTWISPRILPAGCMFSEKAPTIFDVDDDDSALTHALGWMASSTVGALIALSVGKEGSIGTAASNSYEVGIIAGLPFADERSPAQEHVEEAYRLRRETAAFDELSLFYRGPRLLAATENASRAAALQREIDLRIGAALGVSADTLALIEATSRLVTLTGEEAFEARLSAKEPEPLDVISFLVGLAFGRYGLPVLTDPDSGPMFAQLPVVPPAMKAAQGEHGAHHPILVDDEGHPDDLPPRIQAMAALVPEGAASLELSASHLRSTIRKMFFTHHVARFSRSRRSAPIYWQLATPSASYSIWLYIHLFSRDTLFRVQNDYAAPKLAHEERRLESLNNELRDGATAAQRKALATQEAFVEELRVLLTEVKRVAPLWNPNLDDGVVINFAPLWRLVPQNKSWQKELKSTWDALCQGEYDWAHLALHLWPERVVPKCAKDRSLAIAHGLEEVFWVEGAVGKWSARKTPTRSIEELVRERTSPAVKTALKSLLEAPAAAGNRGRARVDRRRSAVADRGDA